MSLCIPPTVWRSRIYGDADSIVPPEQSIAVVRAADARLLKVPGAGHNDLAMLDGQRLIDAVVTMVNR